MLFTDRTDAGRQLARKLEGLDDPVVLALPRGGVPVAHEIAVHIGAPLDVIVARKLGAPRQPELGIGAIAEGGAQVLHERAMRAVGASPEELDAVVQRERVELERRVRRYRGDRDLVSVSGCTAVVVDDGLATGVTAEAAVRAVRELGPSRLILAVPVAAPDAVDRLSALVDEVVTVATPADFAAVGYWYEDFTQTDDEEVVELLRSADAVLESNRSSSGRSP